MAQPQPNIPFGIFYNILSCFDRRELCQLRNVNQRHYTVIENKFGTTRPYLVFYKLELYHHNWQWRPALENSSTKMASDVRNQLPLSKFVRFQWSRLAFNSPSENNLDVISISHVWENQDLFIDCASNFGWNEEWIHIGTKAKYLKVDANGIFHYLTQLTSGNCVRLTLTSWDDTLDDVQLAWDHILDFLFKPNTELIVFYTFNNLSNHHRDQMLTFLERVKQKFLESLAPVDFSFGWFANSNRFMEIRNGFIFDDFVVENQRTKQCLRFLSAAHKFYLTVEKLDL